MDEQLLPPGRLSDEYTPPPEIPAEGYAFLDTIAGTESAGQYNVIYGGQTFDDYSDHPRVSVEIKEGPNKGRYSSAAGKYQFLEDTWDDVKEVLDLPDFSPHSQDRAAWWLAERDYKRRMGRDLLSDLRFGDAERMREIGRSLSRTWTSLPGGIEAAATDDSFAKAYGGALRHRRGIREAPIPAEMSAELREQRDLVPAEMSDDLRARRFMAPPTYAEPQAAFGLGQDELMAAYLQIAEQKYYKARGDIELAKRWALDEFKSRFGSSRLSGRPVVMEQPPEANYPAIRGSNPGSGGWDYLQRLALQQARSVDPAATEIALVSDGMTLADRKAGRPPRYALWLRSAAGDWTLSDTPFSVDLDRLTALQELALEERQLNATLKGGIARHILETS
jgi:muramidase (phage lysozyme)